MSGVHHPHDNVYARPSGYSQSASLSEVINNEEYYRDDGASPVVVDDNTPEHEISTCPTVTSTSRYTCRQDNATPSPLDSANPEGADSSPQINGKADYINTNKDERHARTKIMSQPFRKKYSRISFTTHLASQSKITQMRPTKLQIYEKEDIPWYFMHKAYNQMTHPAF